MFLPANVDTSGNIIALGAAGGGNNQMAAAAPMAGTGEVLTAANINNIHVAKSGRTTGLTCTNDDNRGIRSRCSHASTLLACRPRWTPGIRSVRAGVIM